MILQIWEYFVCWFVRRNKRYCIRRIQWTYLIRENHLSRNRILDDVSKAWEETVLVFLWPHREGGIGVKFERKFTENSGQDHVE